MKNKLIVGLCKGRHNLPVDKYIYENELNPLDLEKLNDVALYQLNKILEENKIDAAETELVIYVTGLTVALIELIKVAVDLCFYGVVLMHYDRDSDFYYEQTFI